MKNLLQHYNGDESVAGNPIKDATKEVKMEKKFKQTENIPSTIRPLAPGNIPHLATEERKQYIKRFTKVERYMTMARFFWTEITYHYVNVFVAFLPFTFAGLCYCMYNRIIFGPFWFWIPLSIMGVDTVVPITQASPWVNWIRFFDNCLGKELYWGLEIISELTEEDEKDLVKNNTDSSGNDSKPSNNYLMTMHPHGIMPPHHAPMLKWFREKFGIKILSAVADAALAAPILKRNFSWFGGVAASKKSMIKNMKRAYPYNVLCLFPGGVAECFYGMKHEQVVLRKRKGFVKLALQTGVSLIPCYCINVGATMNRWYNHNSLMAKLSSKLGLGVLLFNDRFGIPQGCVPFSTKKMLCLVGRPIKVMKTGEPTQEEIDELSEKYITELKALFNRHKHKMGPGWENRKLYMEDEEVESDHEVLLDKKRQ